MIFSIILLSGMLVGGVFPLAVLGGLLPGRVVRQRQHTIAASARPGLVDRLADDLALVARLLTGNRLPHTLLGASGRDGPTVSHRADQDAGCRRRSFVIAGRTVRRTLRVDSDTVINLGILQPCRHDYSRGIGMYTGCLIIAAAEEAA